ncbi:DUF3472 domain-containing protein [Ideonella sp. DXS29W]|uniref:DUF3472 domain-containing protein n=1 Tax=Ideonella lacteola TaxID=2984193 RepID=A0ABU9C208_9BURK
MTQTFSSRSMLFELGVAAALLIAASPSHAIYTDYAFDDETPAYDMEMYSTWAFDPKYPNNIFASFQFFFESWQLGYIGTTIYGETQAEKGAIFAIWDDGEGSGTAQPVSGKGCERFEGEGTGTSCAIPYKWVAGHEYRHHIRSLGYKNGAEHWKGTITDMTTGVETLLGTIAVKDIGDYKGYGRLHPGGVTFLEFFATEGCKSNAYTRVTWRGPYLDDHTRKANSARASYDPDGCTNDNNIGKRRPRVIQESGKGVIRTTPDGEQLWTK